MNRETLETAFRRLGGIPALARSEGGAKKIIDIVMAELARESRTAEQLAKAVEWVKPHMYEAAMEAETDYERAVINLWKRLAAFRKINP